MAIVFPEFECPTPLQELDIDIASIIQDAHEADEVVGVLALATRIRRHMTADISLLAELCQRSPISSLADDRPPREALNKLEAEGGLTPKPRITITAAMQRPDAN